VIFLKIQFSIFEFQHTKQNQNMTALYTAIVLMAVASSDAAFTMVLDSISAYPGYTGSYTVQLAAPLAIIVIGNTVNLKGKLAGLPASQTAGIHIHESSSCDSSALGHYWEGVGGDPWLVTKYTSNPEGVSEVDVNTTLDADASTQLAGRTIVVHSADAKIACGVIRELSPDEFFSGAFAPFLGITDEMPAGGKFDKYFDYKGSLAAGESVSLSTNNVLSWDLDGLEPSTTGGIHIHVGMNCMEDAGGHYYKGSEDLWNNVMWTSDANGRATGNLDLNSNTSVYYPFAENVDHAVVIHSSAASGKARIACAVLSRVTEAFGYVKAYKTNGQLTLEGWAQNLQGSDGVSGGWHVHEGTTCEAAGGHLKYVNGSDPWTNQMYTVAITEQGGANKSRTTFELDEIIDQDVGGHVVVLHDSNGYRVACAPLNLGSSTSSPVGTTAPTSGASNYFVSVIMTVVFALVL